LPGWAPACSRPRKWAKNEKLKQGDMLESSFGEFASESPALYETIIGERDRYGHAPARGTQPAAA
jgi:hypothetical protein